MSRELCKNGHFPRINTPYGQCRECKAISNKKHSQQETARDLKNKWRRENRKNNPGLVRQKSREYVQNSEKAQETAARCMKRWRDENQEKIKEYEFKRRKEVRPKRRRILIEMLGDRCSNCLNSFPDVVYDFHHINPKLKSFNIGHRIMQSWKLVQEEAKKCVLLCANCHRILHYRTGEKD